MDPVIFYKSLADDTRLKCLLLIAQYEPLCVCQLTEALELSQPKVSRHLAGLRQQGLLVDERRGKWVFYSVNRDLPSWAKEVLSTTLQNVESYLAECLKRLSQSSFDLSKCC